MVLCVAAVSGAIAQSLRQPCIIAFVLAGILLGPAGLDGVHAHEQVDLFAEFGIGLLLFVVGLKLDPRSVRAVGFVALKAGAVQMLLTATLGYGAAATFELAPLVAAYVAAPLMFSSTVIIVKLLADKREIELLHGRINLGIQILRDIVAVLLVILVATAASPASTLHFGQQVIEVLAKGVSFLGIVALPTRFLLPSLPHTLARQPEPVMLFAIACAIGLTSLAVALGFGKEVGAFVAGGHAVEGRSRGAAHQPARFLVALLLRRVRRADRYGASRRVSPAGAGAFGNRLDRQAADRRRDGQPLRILTSRIDIGQAQSRPDQRILADAGRPRLSLGRIDRAVASLISLIGLVTIGLSTYMIQYSEPSYGRLASMRLLRKRDEAGCWRIGRHEEPEPDVSVDAIVIGLGRYGRSLAQALRRRGRSVHG